MKVISLFLTVIVAGCASSGPAVVYNYSSEVVEANLPNVGELVTRNVGDSILVREKYTSAVALRLKTPVPYGLHFFPAGNYKMLGSNETTSFFAPLSDDEKSISLQGNARQYVTAIAVKKSNVNTICPIHLVSGMQCIDAFASIEKQKFIDQNSYEQTLIYNGNSGSKINIGYREFSEGLARPAFNNNVEYDLEKSKIISYKGAQIEVVEANNNTITFKILKKFPTVN